MPSGTQTYTQAELPHIQNKVSKESNLDTICQDGDMIVNLAALHYVQEAG